MTVLSGRDLAVVAEYLVRSGAPVQAPLESTLIAGGRSNLTFLLEDGPSKWVLRMPPRRGRTPSAHDVVREFKITSALRSTEVPVAPTVAVSEDGDALGLPFAVWEFVEGTTVQTANELAGLSADAIAGSVDAMIESLAALHGVDHRAVGLERLGKPDGYSQRQLRRWSGQWDLVATDDAALVADATALRERLERSVPPQQATGIVHGDFRIDNAILNLVDSPPSVAAIVDWELSTIGDPVADVAMMCAYRHPALDLILGAPSAWTSDRLPDPAQLAAAYESASGVVLAHWDFQMALAHFKIAVIAAGIDYRFRSGATSGTGFDTAADAVGPLLKAGLGYLSLT